MKINDYKTEELVKILNRGLAAGKSGVAICKEIGLARSSVLTRVKRDGYIHDKEQNKYVKDGSEEIIEKKEIKKKTAVKKNNSKKEVKKDTNKDIKKNTKKETKTNEKNKNEIITEKNTKKEMKKSEIAKIDDLGIDREEEIEEINLEKSISTIDIEGKSTEIEESYEGEWKVEEAIAKLRKELENKKKKEKKVDNKPEIKIEEESPIIEKSVKKNSVDINEEKIEETINATEIQLGEFENLKMMIKALDKRLEMVEKQKNRSEEKTVSIKNTKETTTRSIRLYKEVNDKLNKYLKKNKEKKVIDIISLAILEYVEK